MKKYNRLIILIVLIGTVFTSVFADALPYLNQTPPDTIPQIFAPGIVSSSEGREFSCSFSLDADEIYFYRYGDGSPARILSAKVTNGEWTTPAEFSLTAAYPALEPHITLDNQRLYFGWNVGNDAIPGGIEGGIYMSQRNGDTWSAPVLAGQGMYITSDLNDQLYITDMSGLPNGVFLAKVIVNSAGIFTGYQRLNINPYYYYQTHPCISPDGGYLLFNIGGEHMFVSFKKPDGSWSEGIDLTSHGFDIKAGGPYLSPDGKYLFFHKEGDIWWVDAKVVKKLNPYVGIGDDCDKIPDDIQLFQNYPNPFNPTTTIKFQLSALSKAKIQIFDATGREISTVINQILPAGNHKININAADFTGGIYFYSLYTDNKLVSTRKMIFIK